MFGHSLGSSDEHLAEAIYRNGDLSLLAVGLHGAPSSQSNQRTYEAAEKIRSRRDDIVEQRGSGKPLEVPYFDSSTAFVWG